jgi:hypothetical protein
MMRKGRGMQHLYGGENCNFAKLTTEQVTEIIKRHKEGEKQRAIARAYGIGIDAIFRIVHGITWKHIHTDGGVL